MNSLANFIRRHRYHLMLSPLYLFAGFIALVAILISLLGSSMLDRNHRSPVTEYHKFSSVICSESQIQMNTKQEVDSYNQSQHLEWKPGGATYGPGNYLDQEKLYRILYSPGLDSCVKVVIDLTLLQGSGGMSVYEESYGFYDAVTDEYLDWIDTVKHGAPYYSMDDLAQKISTYETATSSPVSLGAP